MTTNPNVKDVTLYGDNIEPPRRSVLSSALVSTFGWLDWSPGPGGYITDYVVRTLALLIEQFRVDRPNINKLITCVTNFCQEIEDVLYDLIRFRCIGLATGEQLDKIGEMVGISRTNSNDDSYRSDIYFQIYLNRSSGEPETLLSSLQRITGGKIDYCEPGIACILLTINQAIYPIPSNIYTKTKALTAGGVALHVQYNNATDQFVFGGDVDSSGMPLNDPYFSGLGFSEIVSGLDNPEGGGSFTELIA